MINSVLTRCKNMLASPRFLFIMITVTVVTHIGAIFAPFGTDDYMQRVALVGNESLYEKGFAIANPDLSFWERIANTFNFFDAEQNNLQGLKDFGSIPWWTDDNAKVHFYRPLAAITHWIDYNLWPDNQILMHIESLVLFVLLTVALYRLYLFSGELATVAGLATLFFCVDPSHISLVGWLAARNAVLSTLFGVLCISYFIRWRTHFSPLHLIWSCIHLVLSLLSAEAGLATFGYLFAYMLWVDAKPIKQRALALLPFVGIILIWRYSYNEAGFGSSHVAHYVDPGRDLLRFMNQLVINVPLIFSSIMTGIDNIFRLFSIGVKQQVWYGFVVLVVFMMVLLSPVIIKNKQCRFWITGSLIACVPPSALNEISGRIFGFISIGFFIVIAHFVRWVLASDEMEHLKSGLRGVVVKVTAHAALIFHFAVPFVGLLVASAVFIGQYALGQVDKNSNEQFYDISGYDYQDKTVVFINPPYTFVLQFIPYYLAMEGKPLPRAIRILAPGHSDIHVEREDGKTLMVEAKGGFSIVHNADVPVEKLKRQASLAHLSRALMGFYRTNERNFFPGQQFELNNTMFEVTSIVNQLPERVMVTFDRPINDYEYLFIAWDWKKKVFYEESLAELAGGKTFAGPGG